MKLKSLIILLFLPGLGYAQSALKLEEQQSKFYYTQLNLHGGFIHDINGERWDFSTKSPANQAVFQVFSKNQRGMQRGYTRLINVASWKARLGFEYANFVSPEGVKTGNIKFKMLDTWVKFKTKWDRTSITVGNKSIPYGHNPKIDPVSSFMINSIKMDLGFAQDLGIFIKTPVAKNADLEVSFTSGGVLNKPVLVCNNLIVRDQESFDLNPSFTFSEYSYAGTWLLTSRLGSPTYKKSEFGLNVVAGHIHNTAIVNDISHIYRIGGDWVLKKNERFKIVNQAFAGATFTSTQGDFISVNIMNSIDYFTGKNWMVSASHSTNLLEPMNDEVRRLNYSIASSLSYIFSPHTRLRLNAFLTRVEDANETQCGALVQFVTGFGKRP
jgi:hypothetical protein